MSYKTLTAGDVRQEGDEQRTKELGTSAYIEGPKWLHRKLAGPGHWYKTNKGLHGCVILASDLLHLDFRRPV